MKAVILAGGLGTRISEESDYIPKPMIRMGQAYFMTHDGDLSAYDVNGFIIRCGYKGFSNILQITFFIYLMLLLI